MSFFQDFTKNSAEKFGYITKMLYLCEVIKNKSNMKWSELRRIAERNGWLFQRNGGKHDIYVHPDKDYKIEIERHGSQEVKPGLYYKLKKQIGF
ncbi:MAG: type II toxin-antitoxin system HicA family toxin [Candidatus Symbiothrix sp.]|jgi:predicted RNA binding protein YcfA (HicA-like mRNA interferase family)|nr:type II toxin-antitoxin system HicA family toxin [Candidatus Symbiothrix sp.]